MLGTEVGKTRYGESIGESVTQLFGSLNREANVNSISECVYHLLSKGDLEGLNQLIATARSKDIDINKILNDQLRDFILTYNTNGIDLLIGLCETNLINYQDGLIAGLSSSIYRLDKTTNPNELLDIVKRYKHFIVTPELLKSPLNSMISQCYGYKVIDMMETIVEIGVTLGVNISEEINDKINNVWRYMIMEELFFITDLADKYNIGYELDMSKFLTRLDAYIVGIRHFHVVRKLIKLGRNRLFDFHLTYKQIFGERYSTNIGEALDNSSPEALSCILISITGYFEKLDPITFESDIVRMANSANYYFSRLGESKYTYKLVSENLDIITEKDKILANVNGRKLKFEKDGSELYPLGPNEYLVRKINKDSYNCWQLAFDLGIPVEEIVINPKTGKPRVVFTKSSEVLVFCKYSGESVKYYKPRSREEEVLIENKMNEIESMLLRAGVIHGHLHRENFTISYSDSGELIVRVIDFDQAIKYNSTLK